MAREKLVREGIAALLGEQLLRLEVAESQHWQQWQGSSAWALNRLRAVREKIYTTVPADRWAQAHGRLKFDYDLSGEPYSRGSW